MKTPVNYIILLGLFLFSTHNIYGQSGLCDSNTPFYNVDLSSNPDSIWISPPDVRVGGCCGTSHPIRCIEFEVLLEPNAAGIIFDIYSGAMPSGALFYQVNCGPEIPIGEMICLEGPGPHTITFCKPGANQNEYTIQSIPGTFNLYGTGTTKGCDADIYVEGLIDSTIVWHELTSGTGEYDSLFTCLTGCDTTQFNSTPGMPDSLQIQVCGYLEPSVCSFTSIYRCDTLSIPINEPLSVELDSYYKFTCYDELPFEIAPTINGYTPSIIYEWYDSTDLLGNLIGTDSTLQITETGYYSVLVYDTLFSACSRDTANVFIEVFPFPEISPISNDTLCLGESLTVTPTVTIGSLNWYINDTLYCGNCSSTTFNPLSEFTVTLSLTDSIGCMDSTEFSIYTNPTFAPTQTIEICDNDSFLLPSGTYVNTAGVYVDSFASVFGCDSVWTTTVIVHPTFAPAQT
ncbi:MAG: hypothetical protein KDE33_27990, partial [Bacteroidetes bacterium]|nr:hypothetical protein [Bacteroidota bacterium]